MAAVASVSGSNLYPLIEFLREIAAENVVNRGSVSRDCLFENVETKVCEASLAVLSSS